jgi:muramoyltetrapeptide carboxypeptidase
MSIKRLPKHGVIAVTSPSSPVVPERLERGVHYLESLGYRVKVGKSNYCSDAYFAGSILDRANELNAYFSDPEVDAIFCGRGGFGSMYLLPYLNYDAIKKSSKLFVGFSDITALQWGIWVKTGMPSISAGMVATDMANEPINTDFEQHFWEVLDSGKCSVQLLESAPIEKTLSGPALPGTLAVAAKLIGTQWFPSVKDTLLIFEDVDEPMHKIDGYLGQFRMAGYLDDAAGVVLGTFNRVEKEPYPEVPSFDAVINRIFDGIQQPLARNTRYGHIKDKLAIPLGLPICVSLGANSSMFNPISLYDF